MNRTVKITITLVVAVIITILGLKYVSRQETKNILETKNMASTDVESISIANNDINEENFTGKVSTVNGPGVLVETANTYIQDTLNDFRTLANEDASDILAKWGPDNPIAKYSINLQAEYIVGDKTESILINEYRYTSGASGMSSYKVFTMSKTDNKILDIRDVIKSDQQENFVAFVVKKLQDWRPGGMTESPLFPETASSLSIDSLKNWAMDEENLIIYFDKYSIGPGALGAVPFSLPLTEVNNFLAELFSLKN